MIWCMVVMVYVTGCIDDRGNYDYLSSDVVLPIMISGPDTSFNCLIGEVLRLEPIVTGMDSESDLKYTWFVCQRGVAYSKEDTIGYCQELEWLVDSDVSDYNLIFEVRDTVRDLFVKKTWSLSVATAYSTGWFVLEDDGNNTDLDVVMPDGKTMEDLMTVFRSGRMEGKARKIVYKDRHPQEVEDVNGKVTKEYRKVFTIISEKDMRVYDMQNMSVLKYRQDCFYEMPVNLLPLDIATESGSDEVNIGGKFYLMSTGNVGKFGYPMMGLDGSENYRIFKEGILYSQHCYLWDEVSRSFVYAYTHNSGFVPLNTPGDGEVDWGPVSNTNCEMKRFLFRNYDYEYKVTPATWSAYALWKNGDGVHELLDLSFVATDYPIKNKYRLPAGSLLAAADVVEAHQTEEKVFFAKDNRLFEHNVNSKPDLESREREVYIFPAGEKISCIRHLVVDRQNVKEKMNRLIVLTNSESGWKLYGFEFMNGGGEFDTAVRPEEILLGRGKGRASYVMRMDSNKSF